jgi:uncharacterized protein (TIGR02001 family)
MNKLLVLLSSVLLSTSTLAMSGHVGISTDYMWRGQTQSDHGLAVNFGIEQDLGQGFYIGNWNSSVDIDGDRELESDFYGGFTKSFESGLWFNGEYIAYRYSGDNSDGLDFEEIIWKVGYESFSYGKAEGVDLDMDYEWYNIGLPFISWADVSLELGEWSDGREVKMLKADWSLSDSMTLGLLVMSDVKESEVEFGDAVSLHFTHKF